MLSFLLVVGLAVLGGLKALVLRYKTELVAVAVVGLAELFASPFDRYLIGAAIAAAFVEGLKLGHRSSSTSASGTL